MLIDHVSLPVDHAEIQPPQLRAARVDVPHANVPAQAARCQKAGPTIVKWPDLKGFRQTHIESNYFEG